MNDIARAFIAARRYVIRGEFICIAISLAKGMYTGRPEDKIGFIRAKQIIKDLLEGSYTLEDWLLEKHGINVLQVPYPERKHRMTKLRLDWLNYLIKKYGGESHGT